MIAIDIIIRPPKELLPLLMGVLLFQKKVVPYIPENGIPHISLAMGVIQEDKLGILKTKLEKKLSGQAPFQVSCYEIANKPSKNGNINAWWKVQREDSIDNVHKVCISSISEFNVSNTIAKSLINKQRLSPRSFSFILGFEKLYSGTNFDPHITLGKGELTPLDSYSFKCSHLEIHELGDHCTCQRLITKIQFQ